MQKRLLVSITFFVFIFQLSAQKNFVQYVDPFIGTGGHGHTYPGAVLPHGMVQLSPDTRLDGWDGCSGYHYSDNYIYGFTHTHLSGTGCSDYGDILLMPMNGQPSPDNTVYGSKFSHANEHASPGFYSVRLDNGIDVALTTTERVGFHKYLFSAAGDKNVILDLKHRDEVLESSIQFLNDHTVAGMRRSKAWAENQYIYFVITFSKPFIKSGIWEDDKLVSPRQTISESKNIKVFFQFADAAVMAKVAISGVSIEGAQKNLRSELPGWNFEQTKKTAAAKWNVALNKIEVTSDNTRQLRTFYTALYHTMVVPNINMDVDGQYRGRDNQIHTAKGFTNYSVFSLWDTYRGANPLYTIIDQKRTQDYINTFLVQYQEGGRLPVWELSGNETDCMIGYHSVPVIVDAYMKGINKFDTKLALEAMKKSATWQQLGLPALMDHGIIEIEDEHENVSKTLEYAYDDWCIAQFAKKLGSMDDYAYYIKRAQAYKNMLDVKTGFMRPRKNGNWVSPFDAREVNNNFTEANSWQYSFYMPQDVDGYMQMIGGRKKLEDKLDALFTEPQQTTGREQADITGLIGQYAHGNEPSHHIAYLYDFTDAPYKAQERIHQIMTEMYHDAPDGLAGNEDCGQMSAWYVLSALGIYQVTPGTTDLMIGTPQFPSATIHLENGKAFTIVGQGVTKDNFYVHDISLNNVAYHKPYLSFQDIMNGGKMLFTMSKTAAPFSQHNYASTSINDNIIVLNPVVDGGARSFRQHKEVKLYSYEKNVNYYYTLDGSTPTAASKKYTSPFGFDVSTIVKAIAVNSKGQTSFVTTANFKLAPNDWSIKLNTNFEQQYDAGGAEGLIDGERGSTNWRKGNWMGFQKNDLDAVIDLKKEINISQLTMGFLQDTKAWIVVPKKITIEISLDGESFIRVYTGNDFLSIEDLNVQVKNITATFSPVSTRYVRIKAEQYGKLPAWHEGAGGDTHIFVDEVEIK